MLTRARRGLVLFGAAETLEADDDWRAYLRWPCSASLPPLARILTSSLSLSLILAPTLTLSLIPALPLTRRAYPYP